MPNGSGKILFVDDNKLMRQMIKDMLEKLGYLVVIVSLPDEAINLFKKDKNSIDLLLTDFMMPGLNGYELKKIVENIMPGIKTLIISGEPIDTLKTYYKNMEAVNFLQKPFSVCALADKISEVMGDVI